MNVSLDNNLQNPFTAAGVGVPAPNCNGGTAYIDQNTGFWDCTAPPPQQNSSGGLAVFVIALAVGGYLFWKYGQEAQKKIGAFL